MDRPKVRLSRFIYYLILNRQVSVAQSTQLIQPLISTDAVSGLSHFVPGVKDGIPTSDQLVSRADSVSRYMQVALTSLPLVSADLLAIAGSYLIATLFTYQFFGANYYWGLWNNLFAVCLCHMVVGMFLGLFPASGMNPVRELRSQITSICISFVLLIALNGLVGQVTSNEILTILMAFPMTVSIAPPARFCTRKIASGFRWWGEKVVIVGMNQQAILVYKFMKNLPQRGLKPLGIVVENLSEYWQSKDAADVELLGTTDDLVTICRKNKCHWVIAAVANMPEQNVHEILSRASLVPNLVVMNSRVSLPTIWVETFEIAGVDGVHIRDRLLFPFQRFMKRFSDIFMSSVLLILLSPVLLSITVWIKVRSGGSFIFQQLRIGRGAVQFKALKFRTMVPNAEAILSQYLEKHPEARAEWEVFQKIKADPRVIPGIGNILRRSSLDELPQLWNVLKGEMSLVGPRPCTPDQIDLYRELYPLYTRVRPGITGLWQISGRNHLSYDDRVKLDSYYVRNWSLWLDYYILLRTIRTVIFREGSY